MAIRYIINEDTRNVSIEYTNKEDKEFYSKDVYIIPDYYEGLPVVSVGSNAFIRNKFSKIVLGNNIMSIRSGAFQESGNLKEIILPESLLYISDNAFRLCEYLEKIILPPNLIDIASYSFFRCSSLTSINIPNSVQRIERSAFEACFSLTEVKLSKNLTLLGEKAFYETDIKSLHIPSKAIRLKKLSLPNFLDSLYLSSPETYFDPLFISKLLTNTLRIYMNNFREKDIAFDKDTAEWLQEMKNIEFIPLSEGNQIFNFNIFDKFLI